MRTIIEDFCNALREEEFFNEEAEEWQFPDGTACGLCTSSAIQVARQFDGLVVGYYSNDNSTAEIRLPNHDGHDFALINDRWLVDYWAWHVEGLVASPIFDLSNDADRREVTRLYGSTVKWKPLDQHSTEAMAEDWTQQENTHALTTYLTMMRREGAGEKVVKAHEYRRLHEENANRSAKAYEFKMQNISAVLALNDLPYITGLTPADAYQNLLEEMLLERLENDPAERAMVLSYGKGLLQRWTRPEATSQLQVEAPPAGSTPPEPKRTFKGSKIDHAAREHGCRRLGRSGEDVVLAYERQQLTAAGRTDLADAVEHISRTEGDGTGYDILSYTPEEAKKYIEVKTTNFDKTTSFPIADNDVSLSPTQPEHYHLYRLFEFGSGPAPSPKRYGASETSSTPCAALSNKRAGWWRSGSRRG